MQLLSNALIKVIKKVNDEVGCQKSNSIVFLQCLCWMLFCDYCPCKMTFNFRQQFQSEPSFHQFFIIGSRDAKSVPKILSIKAMRTEDVS